MVSSYKEAIRVIDGLGNGTITPNLEDKLKINTQKNNQKT